MRPRRSAADLGSAAPQPARQLATSPGLRCARGGGRRRQPIGVDLNAPTPSRRGPVGCESSPQPHRRPPACAQSSRGVSGRRCRARGSPPPPVGLSRNSGNPQTRKTYGPTGVTSPATPGSLSTILGWYSCQAPPQTSIGSSVDWVKCPAPGWKVEPPNPSKHP